MAQSNHFAVVVIDMLRDYFDSSLWPGSALPGSEIGLAAEINRLTRSARSSSVPVFWVRQQFAPDLSDAFPHMRKANRSYTIKGTDGCRLLKELETELSDIDLVKKRFSAFFETDLDSQLRTLGTRTILLAGITTSWCVRSTAVDAYQLGYDVVLVDGTLAGFDPIDHANSVREMDGYLARLLTVDAVGNLFSAELTR